MDDPKQSVVLLFVGGPLHGLRANWVDPPTYYPHPTEDGMVPYSRRTTPSTVADVDAVYAPVGMTDSAFVECFLRVSTR
jgi:hypothetical protein